MYREGWIVVNTVPTHVLTWGGWIEDEIEGNSIMLCITGSPGVSDFYKTFLSALHLLIDMPVWVINFAGCEIPSDTDLVVPSITGHRDLYNFTGQIKHKHDFIHQYIPKSKHIYMIGHSLGGKIVVELLKDEELCSQIEQTYLLFPTLENMAQTRNGRFVAKVLPFFISSVYRAGWLLTILPERIKLYFLHFYFRLRTRNNVDENCILGGLKLFNSKVMLGVFYLTQDGMNFIKELDCEFLNKFGHKVNCYYSKTDGWAPLVHYENIRRVCPTVKAVVMEDHFKHAFVLSTPKETADKLSQEINEYRNKITAK